MCDLCGQKKIGGARGGGAAKSANAWIRPHSATGQLPCSLVARLKVGNTSDDYLLWCWLVNHVHVFGKAFPCFDHRQQRSHSAWYKQRRHTNDTMFDVLKKKKMNNKARDYTRDLGHVNTHVISDGSPPTGSSLQRSCRGKGARGGSWERSPQKPKQNS